MPMMSNARAQGSVALLVLMMPSVKVYVEHDDGTGG